MNRIIIFTVVVAVLTLLDIYVWQGVKYLTRNLSSYLRIGIGVLYWGLPALVLGALFLRLIGYMPMTEKSWRFVVMGGFIINFFPKLVLGIFLLLDDLLRGGKWVYSKFTNDVSDLNPDGEKISRSDFLLKAGVITAGVPLLASTFGIISGAHDYRVRKKTLFFPNLPKEFDGIRIGQLSDIHSGSFFNKVAVQGGVEMMNAEKPDVLFFTGDLVNDKATEVREYIDVFDKLKAPLGVHSVLGNHDYGLYVQWESEQAKRRNIQGVIDAHKEMGWQILLNENRALTVDGASIGILGVENWGEGFIKVGDLNKAYSGTEEYDFKLLMSHDPSHWRAEILPQYNDIDLTLSGHTHGMQFGIEIGDFQWSPVKYKYKEWGGLYTEGNQDIYVNRGFGYIGYPGRIGILPELTILELKRGDRIIS